MTAKDEAPKGAKTQPHTVKLSKPLETHNGAITELTLTEPDAGLVLTHGLPWTTIVHDKNDEQSFQIEYIPSKMVLYLEGMSGIDKETLSDMRGSDMVKCFTAILSMLNQAGN